jgi:hypothetical protein
MARRSNPPRSRTTAGGGSRPLRLNYSFAPERIERLKATPEFRDIATSRRTGKERDEEVRSGEMVQRDIVLLLEDMDGRCIYHDREEFRLKLESLFRGFIRLPDYFWDVLMDALSEPEEADPKDQSTRRS